MWRKHALVSLGTIFPFLFLCLSLWPNQGYCQSLTATLFYDGATDPWLANAVFGKPVIDSSGRVSVAAFWGGSGFVVRVNSISPSGVLNWQSPSLGWDTFAPVTVILGPQDRIFVHPGFNIIHGFAPSGSTLPGWPVSITGTGGGTTFKTLPVVDAADGTIYLKVGVNFSWSTFPASVVAINPNGTEKWRKDYPDDPATGGGPVQGPGRYIYTIIANRALPYNLVVLDSANGNQVCQVSNVPANNVLFSGQGGVFTSFNSDVTATNQGCSSTLIFSSPRGEVGLRDTDSGKIFGIDYPIPNDGNQVRLFAISESGSLLWRNPRISFPGESLIQAKHDGILYLLGQDTSDGNKPKLFLYARS